MPHLLDPRLDILPAAQREIWPLLSPASGQSLVLYGGTAIALRLGHRQSIDFDFFCANPLDKRGLQNAFGFMAHAAVVQDSPDTLVVLANMSSGSVKVSFFGRLSIGHFREPDPTVDGVLTVASLDDLMATKLKAILDRAEAKDYRDIAEMLSAGVSLSQGLAIFRQMFRGEPAEVLRAIGYFGDGDLASLGAADKQRLRRARDAIRELPDVQLKPGLSAADRVGQID